MATRIAGSHCEFRAALPPAGGFSSDVHDHAARSVSGLPLRSERVGTVRRLTHFFCLALPGPCGVISKAVAGS